MEFQTASALWWLLPLAGVIIVLYLLKMRRRDVRVPAVFLWPKLTADVRANAPIQKLRVSLLLILQLLAIALLVFALANPLRKERGLSGKATAIVLDASASMEATDVSPTRFDAARKRVASMVASMGTGDRLALIEAGSTTQVIFPLTNDKAKMTAALGNLHPTDAPNDMGEALRLASALVGQRSEGRIIVLSDGAFPPVTNFSPGKAEMAFEPVGASAKNVAVTAFDSSELPDGKLQLFAGLQNFGSDPATATVTFTVDGQVTDARRVTIQAHQRISQTLQIAGTARRATVQLEASGDILKSDNTATLFLQGVGTIHTLLVTSGNLFLERALALEPTVRLDKAPTVPNDELAEASGPSKYDLVIFDGVPPVGVKASAVWAFGAASSTMAVTDVGLSPRPHVVTWRRSHPVLQHTDLDGLLIQKAHKIQAKASGTVLVTGSDGPLMVASDHGGQRSLYVGWNILDSDLPLHIAFPIFVDNAVTWLTGASHTESGGLSVRAGQSFSVPAPAKARTLTLTDADGKSSTLDASTGMATIRSADIVGDYTITGPDLKTSVAVNLLNDTESNVAPHVILDLSGHSVASKGRFTVLAETWRPIVLVTLLLLGLEWWIFVRRS